MNVGTTATSFLLLLVASAFQHIKADNDTHWSYEEYAHGPSSWKDDFPACGGDRQSPIDIAEKTTRYANNIGRFKFSGYDTVKPNYIYLLKNNGHTAQMDIEEGDIWMKGAALADHYRLAQVHFHWGAANDHGSEHTLNEQAYPMEIHFVHYNSRKYSSLGEAVDKPGGLAVIGVFVEVDRIAFPNEAMQHFVEHFASVHYKGNVTRVRAFELVGLLPPNPHEFYRYAGSLTTPPCYETVVWTVMRHPLKISQIQMNAFHTLSQNRRSSPDVELADNFRPTQPLGARSVYRSFRLPIPRSMAVVYKPAGWPRSAAPISGGVPLLVAMAIVVVKLFL